jgi:hypothetical protein
MLGQGKCSSNSRVLLNQHVAVQIYQHKLSLIQPKCFKSCLLSDASRMRGASAKLSRQYGVSPKAIRDIWNHKSWVKATIHLWQDNADDDVQVISLFLMPIKIENLNAS